MPDTYRALVAGPGVAAVLAAGAAARLPVSMYGLALLLLADHATGSLGAAGGVAAAAAVGYAVGGPVLGRFADRFGPLRPLVATAAVNAAAFAVFLVVAAMTPTVWALAVAAVVVGASVPPVAACQRALWRGLLSERLLESALALDSLQLDAFLIAGPLLITGIDLVAGPSAAVVVTAVLMAGGTVAFAVLPACRRLRPGAAARGLGPLRAQSFRLLLGTVAAAGMALGLVRVSLIGFADRAGDPAVGGLLYTAIGIGSAVSGLWYGSREWTLPVERRYAILLALYAVCVLPLLTGFGTGAMFGFAIVTGLALTPVTVGEFALIGRCAPATTVAEAFAWATTATFAGNAAGTGLAGWLTDRFDWRAGVGLAALVLAIAAALAVLRQDLLRPHDALGVTPAEDGTDDAKGGE
jgi:MFS family permease